MIGVVAHDAGAAEIISSYIRQRGLQCIYCLEGAARGVFARKLGVTSTFSLDEIVSKSDSIVTGTSFLSDLEWLALGLARKAGLPTVSVLDHWVNFRQRFTRHGQWHFPDEVWVGDDLAEEIAKRDLPDVRVKLIPNPYFADVKRELVESVKRCGAEAPAGGVRILYVSEPLREDGLALYGDERYWGYTEEEALRFFLDRALAVSGEIVRIAVRPHPQEEADKYDWAVLEYPNLPIVSGRKESLMDQIVSSDVVVGCATMAMVVGLLAGKRVISCTPPNAKTIPLPHPEIESLQALASSAAGRST